VITRSVAPNQPSSSKIVSAEAIELAGFHVTVKGDAPGSGRWIVADVVSLFFWFGYGTGVL
jgi:hypothetical protein